jgi:hypothetical protein
MTYSIIEDCSPYYIRFTWAGLEQLVDYVKNQPRDSLHGCEVFNFTGYDHINFGADVAKKIIGQLPMKSKIKLMSRRVTLFSTHPGGKSSVHKDSVDHRFSINIPIEIHDSKCWTAWWSDESLKDFDQNLMAREGDPNEIKVASRRITDDGRPLPPPDKTMIAVPNECILFNTDIFHTWNNSESTNSRVVLTFRAVDPGSMYFEDAKKILFENIPG